MYRIGIIGPGPERIADHDKMIRNIGLTIDLLVYQYDNDDAGTIFNIGSNIGVDHWAIDYCLNNGIKYHIHMPALPAKVSEHWYNYQRDNLDRFFNHARATTVCTSELSSGAIYESDQNLIDNSNFVVCFWLGIKQGRTANAIKYALSTNKLMLNGLSELKLITNNDFVYNQKAGEHNENVKP